MKKINLILFAGVLYIFSSCSKLKTESFTNFQTLDFSMANDSLGEATREGVVIKSEAEFNTLMSSTGNPSITFPGLQGTELLLIHSREVNPIITSWTEITKITHQGEGSNYQVDFTMQTNPIANQVWRTHAVKADFGDLDADVHFHGKVTLQ